MCYIYPVKVASAKLNKFLAAFEIDLYNLMVFGFA